MGRPGAVGKSSTCGDIVEILLPSCCIKRIIRRFGTGSPPGRFAGSKPFHPWAAHGSDEVLQEMPSCRTRCSSRQNPPFNAMQHVPSFILSRCGIITLDAIGNIHTVSCVVHASGGTGKGDLPQSEGMWIEQGVSDAAVPGEIPAVARIARAAFKRGTPCDLRDVRKLIVTFPLRHDRLFRNGCSVSHDKNDRSCGGQIM